MEERSSPLIGGEILNDLALGLLGNAAGTTVGNSCDGKSLDTCLEPDAGGIEGPVFTCGRSTPLCAEERASNSATRFGTTVGVGKLLGRF